MGKQTGDPHKTMNLVAFIHLVGPRAVAPEPPAWDPRKGAKPDVKARLNRFKTAYLEGRAGHVDAGRHPRAEADFPLHQTKQAWLDSFNAFERLTMVAHALERQLEKDEKQAHDLPPSGPGPFTDHADELQYLSHAEGHPGAETFAGGESGGGGGGTDWKTQQDAYTGGGPAEAVLEPGVDIAPVAETSVMESAPEPLSESLEAPEPVESAPAPASEPDTEG